MSFQSFFIFRLFTSLIFIYAGLNHLVRPEKILGRISRSSAFTLLNDPLPFYVSIVIMGIGMVVLGILLAMGYRHRLAARILLVILLVITLTVQLENLSDLGPFFKNVAIAGSLLFIINYRPDEKENLAYNSSPID